MTACLSRSLGRKESGRVFLLPQDITPTGPHLHLLFEHGNSLGVIEHELVFLVLALSSFRCYLALSGVQVSTQVRRLANGIKAVRDAVELESGHQVLRAEFP